MQPTSLSSEKLPSDQEAAQYSNRRRNQSSSEHSGLAIPQTEASIDLTSSINDTLKNLQKKEKLYQTGKAYLEKKIYEYESRLNNMKTKKEHRSSRQRFKPAQ